MANSQSPTPVNGTMMQAFEWYVAADGKHWQRLARDIPALAQLGITALWQFHQLAKVKVIRTQDTASTV